MKIIEFGMYHREYDDEYFAYEIIQYSKGTMFLKVSAVHRKWGQRVDGSLDWHKGEITTQAGCGQRIRIESVTEGHAILEVIDGFEPQNPRWSI